LEECRSGRRGERERHAHQKAKGFNPQGFLSRLNIKADMATYEEIDV
jgi:hypothetical protein